MALRFSVKIVVKKVKGRLKTGLLKLAKRWFYFRCEPFPSIISNDCFGGEIYRSLNIAYNTPFIGLMIMAPCYIKMLKNLDYYLTQDLHFIAESKYGFINELLLNKGSFPIAVIGNDVEIQFLHYNSEKEARQKWNARRQRLDKNNLFVKFDFSKDLSNETLLNEFLLMKYKKKLAIGSSQNEKFITESNFADIPEYALDGTAFFRLSLRYIDYKKLIQNTTIARPSFLKGYFLYKFLNLSWVA